MTPPNISKRKKKLAKKSFLPIQLPEKKEKKKTVKTLSFFAGSDGGSNDGVGTPFFSPTVTSWVKYRINRGTEKAQKEKRKRGSGSKKGKGTKKSSIAFFCLLMKKYVLFNVSSFANSRVSFNFHNCLAKK